MAISRSESEFVVEIEDDKNGGYSLLVNGGAVCKIGSTYLNPTHREMHFAIYGPVSVDKAEAITHGLMHMMILFNNEKAGPAVNAASRPSGGERRKKVFKAKKKQTNYRTKKS